MAQMQGEGDSDYRWTGLEQEVGLVLVLDLAISPLILQFVQLSTSSELRWSYTLRNSSVANLHDVYDMPG